MGGKISMSSQTWCYGNFQLTRILKRMPGPNISDQTDREYDIEGNDKCKEREMNESSPPVPTVMFNIDGPNISPIEIGEGQVPVSFTLEPNWEALAFCKDYTGRNHFNEEREFLIRPSKYKHARLKCYGDRFPANPQYVFHA